MQVLTKSELEQFDRLICELQDQKHAAETGCWPDGAPITWDEIADALEETGQKIIDMSWELDVTKKENDDG